MYYAVLTKLGTPPFQIPNTPPTPPGDRLRLAKGATLLVFVNQPDRVFASRWAAAYGKILWHVTEHTMHSDDLPAVEFESCHDFQVWLSRREDT